MIFERAIEILDLSRNFTTNELKKAYYKKALIFHPDKNKNEDTTEKFKQINEAYTFLGKKNNLEKMPFSFQEILEKCLHFIYSDNKWDKIFKETTVHSLVFDCKKISLKIFETLNNKRANELYDFFYGHQDIFSFSEQWFKEVNCILKKKKRENIIILNPNIDDLINDIIYKLKIESKLYYIPLWHHELCYDISGKQVVVKCIPELERNMTIDDDNNLYIDIRYSIEKILTNKKIVLKIGNKTLYIPSTELRIISTQIYTFYNRGMLCITDHDIYNTEKRSHIYVNINLY